ncbi:3-isopropylmalate dehydratase small subunit [Vitreimonas sp.]|jgi:3-isopropylmalate/(R)-2-methylmalate dehydratase small subunit|uniref:3-isopropylmalate dehydratase small subunit n=1 Tax=Vitreimonas sp. TaxID=3069702 RepID=UPI002ED79842
MSFEPFIVREGLAAAMPVANVDTDVIMPKQFLKGIDRAGLDRGVFHGLRYDASGAPIADFIFNDSRWRAPRFLIVGPNFGCGSSREHAVWGLMQAGVSALIGTSFAGIFFDNCTRNGLLAICAAPNDVDALLARATEGPCAMRIDLPEQTIVAGDLKSRFEIEPGRKRALTSGLDAVGLTLEHRDAIAAFEAEHFARYPWIKP